MGRLKNKAGQHVGRKGFATRNRIIEALLALLPTRPLRDIKVSEITRMIGAAPSRFGFYFESIEDALLAAVVAHPPATPDVMAAVLTDWDELDGPASIRAFVYCYVDHWERNFDLLKARNLAADEGEVRFLELRRVQATPVREALEIKIGAAQAAGRVPSALHAPSVAGLILAALERIIAVTRYPHGGSAVTRASLIEAAVHMVGTMTGASMVPDAAAAKSRRVRSHGDVGRRIGHNKSDHPVPFDRKI